MYIGVEIGGTKLQLCVVDDDLNIIDRIKDDVGETKKSEIILSKMSDSLNTLITKYDINSIGVGFGGPINCESGIISTSHHVSGWVDFNLKSWLVNNYKVPVFVDNDANVAAFGEAHLGAGKGLDKVFYVTLGSGVGGGFIINGEIYHGAKIVESEIGHLRLDKSGRILESSCSGWAVDNKIKNYVATNPRSILADLIGENCSNEAKFLSLAIEKGDIGAKKILENTADDLAFGLSHVVHLIDPEIVILGGGLSLIGDLLIRAVENALPKYLMNVIKEIPKIKKAALKEDVVALGAALLAKYKNIQTL